MASPERGTLPVGNPWWTPNIGRWRIHARQASIAYNMTLTCLRRSSFGPMNVFVGTVVVLTVVMASLAFALVPIVNVGP